MIFLKAEGYQPHRGRVLCGPYTRDGQKTSVRYVGKSHQGRRGPLNDDVANSERAAPPGSPVNQGELAAQFQICQRRCGRRCDVSTVNDSTSLTLIPWSRSRQLT